MGLPPTAAIALSEICEILSLLWYCIHMTMVKTAMVCVMEQTLVAEAD